MKNSIYFNKDVKACVKDISMKFCMVRIAILLLLFLDIRFLFSIFMEDDRLYLYRFWIFLLMFGALLVVRVLEVRIGNKFSMVITVDCDPVKYEKILKEYHSKKWLPVRAKARLGIVPSLIMAGKWEEGRQYLDDIPLNRIGAAGRLIWYNLYGNYYAYKGDFQKLHEIKSGIEYEKTGSKKRLRKSKETVLEILNFHLAEETEGPEQMLKRAEKFLDAAQLPMQKVSYHYFCGKYEKLSGNEEEAKAHLKYAVKWGGTMNAVVLAQKLLAEISGNEDGETVL